MPSPIKLSKLDARRAFLKHHLTPCATQQEVFERLRSIQFDPIAPVGCNHDLVLQARVPGYKIGDWEKLAYEDRLIYDGWDKQASLVPFEGWPLRRIYRQYHEPHFKDIFADYGDAIQAVLKDLEERGPLMPKEFEFQERKAEWKSAWYSPNVTKRILRALWHTGIIMTSGRRKGQHLYDLAERVVPAKYFNEPVIDDEEAKHELAMERHRAVGILRPNSGPEIWSYSVLHAIKLPIFATLVDRGELIPVDVEGVKAHVTPEFLTLLDSPAPESKVTFVGPLDQIVWDRKMIAHLFGFDYVWEIYIPEAKRRWGYYVLPILFGDAFVARVEFYCREGVLEMRQWHFEDTPPDPGFWPEFEDALRRFMVYCSAKKVTADPSIDKKVRDVLKRVSSRAK